MNTLQQIIKEMEDDKEKAKNDCFKYWETDKNSYWIAKGMVDAFSLYIPKLTLLLNAETQTTVKSKQA